MIFSPTEKKVKENNVIAPLWPPRHCTTALDWLEGVPTIPRRLQRHPMQSLFEGGTSVVSTIGISPNIPHWVAVDLN